MHLRSVGQSWDKLPALNASLDDLDLDLVNQYVQRASEVRGKKVGHRESPKQILEKMELIKDGKPTWAALLLFERRPQRHLSQAAVHCGRFKDATVVIDDAVIEGTIIEQITATMDFIRKDTKVSFVFTGAPTREEVWEYPLNALREAVINAICHRDYTIPSQIEVRIYDDELIIWSPGRLPEGVTIEDLYKDHHSSVLRNTGISEVFYDGGLIERWGRGTVEMRNALMVAGLPEPRFEEYQHGFQVVFRKDIYAQEYLRGQGLNERQIAAVMFANKEGRITNKEYQELNAVSNKTAYLELSEGVKKGIFALEGSGRNVTYSLKRHMTREEMQRVVDEELEHIPKGARRSRQNELRMTYNMLRLRSLGPNAEGIQTKEDVLREAIKSVRARHPSFTPQYDSDSFKC
jgi:ATP-dependent DNA helicase RecG